LRKVFHGRVGFVPSAGVRSQRSGSCKVLAHHELVGAVHGVKSQHSTNEVGAMTLFRIWEAGELDYATESVVITRLERALKARQKAPQIDNQSNAIVEC